MDWNTLVADAVLALIPTGTMLVLWLWRSLQPSIPPFLIPLLAAVLPALATMLTNFISGGSFSPLEAAVLGALATWLREIISTFAAKGFAKGTGKGFQL